ncbi:hypothetical protein YC2023_075818 [Brassica napus]
MKPDGKSPITSKDLSRRYFHQLISAVGYCHSRSVFHRDLKFHIISGSPGFNLLEMFSDRVEGFVSGWTAARPSNKISPQPSLPTTKKNHSFNPFDDADDEEEVEKRLKPSFKNHFRESGGVENQTVQELESYVVYKSDETTKTQGEKITRTHHKAVDLDHDLTRGEKLLGSLRGIFSRTWKPKKTRSITCPVITRGESPKRRVNNLETREKLGLNQLPKPDSRTNEPLPESADAYHKIEMEKAKQDDGLADLSDLLGELKNMAIDMGTEIERSIWDGARHCFCKESDLLALVE